MLDNNRDVPRSLDAPSTAVGWQVLALGAAWGGGIFLAAIAFDHGVPPLLFAFAEATGIFCVSGALTRATGRDRIFARTAVRLRASTGLTLVVIPYLATYVALGHLGPALAATTQTLTALLTALLAVSVGMAVLSIRQWFGVLLGLTGVVLLGLTGHRTGGPGAGGSVTIWDAIACLAPLSYAVTNVHVSRHRSAARSALADAAGANGIAAGALGVVYVAVLLISHPEWPHPSELGWLSGAGAIGCNLAASLAYFRIAAGGGAVDVGLASYVTTVVDVVLSWTVLRSTTPIVELLAIATTIIGVALARRPKQA